MRVLEGYDDKFWREAAAGGGGRWQRVEEVAGGDDWNDVRFNLTVRWR
jgi:hypothetical protein